VERAGQRVHPVLRRRPVGRLRADAGHHRVPSGRRPPLRSTIDAIARELSASCGLLYRYVDEDGLPGRESTFLLCSYWLAECRALTGQLDEVREIFGRATAYANDVGLLGEEAEPATGELLGNFPQAFSHIGLVNAAWAIARAEQEPVRHPR